ncbi:MAG: hypothetical protein AAB531_04095 [Patescibacteria group bacterium]
MAPIEIEFGTTVRSKDKRVFTWNNSKNTALEPGEELVHQYISGRGQAILVSSALLSSDNKGGIIDYMYLNDPYFLNVGFKVGKIEKVLVAGEEEIVREFTNPRNGDKIGFKARLVPQESQAT